MAETKVYTIQPRFTVGDVPAGWSLVEGIFRMGTEIPAYGTLERDTVLARAWQDEPMTAGVIAKWIERGQSVNWKITGGRNQAWHYARMFADADQRGWSYFFATGALNYLTTDKGTMDELGRVGITPGMEKKWQNMEPTSPNLDSMQKRMVQGPIGGMQHLDATRCVRFGLVDMMWRYYPSIEKPVFIPDDNLIQVTSMPNPDDAYRGLGHCAMSRLADAKELMVGYLTFFRQEVGQLPPELAVIINGLSHSAVTKSFKQYKLDREKMLNKRTNDRESIYPGLWWLGSDDPATPVSMSINNLLTPGKNFSYPSMVEWWAKTLALNTGEAVGDYWLMQHPGNANTLMSVQSMKAEGSGVGNYLQEQERELNRKVMPQSANFKYDNTNDQQDKQRADILSTNITNLKDLAEIGGDSPLFNADELKLLAVDWNIVPSSMVSEDIPTVVESTLKELFQDGLWTVDRYFNETKLKPVLKSDREREQAAFVYHKMKEWYAKPNLAIAA